VDQWRAPRPLPAVGAGVAAAAAVAGADALTASVPTGWCDAP
jgi:hypothetical protein